MSRTLKSGIVAGIVAASCAMLAGIAVACSLPHLEPHDARTQSKGTGNYPVGPAVSGAK